METAIGAQHVFYAVAFGTTPIFGDAAWPWYSSGIAHFVQGGVVKTFRWATSGFVT